MLQGRISLIVGLGNPGEAYRFTRHNTGFMVIDRLSSDLNIPLSEARFNTIFGKGTAGDTMGVLAKPLTFMNRVGPAVRNLADYFSLDGEDVMVVYDDIDLLFGRLKIKQKGGDGGHNGVKSLIEALESDAFSRVRVGIGRPEHGDDISRYVLEPFDAEQEKNLEAVISTAQDAVKTVLLKGASEAMNQFHGKRISEINIGRRL